jgi:hypothetical protein
MIRSFEEEFALCSRYFTVLSGASGATGATLGNGAVYSTSQAIVSGFFAVKMRTAPTLTASGTDAVQLATSALVYADSSAVSAWFTNVESFQLNVTRTGSGLSAGNCTAANVKSTGTPGYLQFNAEL